MRTDRIRSRDYLHVGQHADTLVKQHVTDEQLTTPTCNEHIYISSSSSSLSYDRSKASSKASSPHSAIQSFLFQMRVPSPFLKVIQ